MVDPGGSSDESQDGLSPGTRLGKYEIVRLLGSGGMGAVYEAAHTEIGKRVAIKVLSPAIAAVPGARARFLREAQLTSRVRHPNIVDVTDMGSDAGQTYLVMEFLRGEDLAQRLGRTGPLSPQPLADIMLPVCSAVVEAHKAGITHRDLKPQNIFLAVGPHTMQPKVLDFGISKGDDIPGAGSLTGTGAMIGTPFYLAPEQIVDTRAAGPNSDQYALGVIMYECLTGRRPFEAENLFVVFQAIVSGNPVPPSQLRPEIPAALEQVVLRAMNLSPAARFPSILALGRAMLPFASSKMRSIWEEAFAGSGEMAVVAELSATVEASSPTPVPPLPAAETPAGTSGPLPSGAHRAVTPGGALRASGGARTPAAGDRSGARATSPFAAAPDLWTISPNSTNETVPDMRGGASKGLKVLVVLGVVVAAGLIGGAALRRTAKDPAGQTAVMPAAGSARPEAIAPAPARTVATGETSPGTREVAAAVSAEAPKKGPPAATPETYLLSVRGDPEEARFELDGAPVGEGKVDRALPLDHLRHTLRVTAPGYEPTIVEFTDQSPPPGNIRLRRARRTAASATSKRRDESKTRSTGRPARNPNPSAPSSPAPNLNPNGAPVID